MTDTPTPLVTPDGAILTTVGDARRVGHGRMSFTPDGTRYSAAPWVAGGSRLPVFWWPDPPPMVTIEIPADVRDFWADENPKYYVDRSVAIIDACRASREAES